MTQTARPSFADTPCTAFAGTVRIAAGPLLDVALALTRRDPTESVLVFADATGRVIDLDLRGDAWDIEARLAQRDAGSETNPGPGRGRPRLGVVAREVTLLPRHWDWLAGQPGGASAALRRLVDQARNAESPKGPKRDGQEAAYRFLSALAGDLPGYEEAIRALFAGDLPLFQQRMAGWPGDIGQYAGKLASGATD